jgi:asparagine synthase (glutamine-hydrolysing)
MSTILFCAPSLKPSLANAYSWLSQQQEYSLQWNEMDGWIRRPDSTDNRWAPFIDRSAGLAVCICGRVAWDEKRWSEVFALDSQTAAELVARNWSKDTESVYALLNGVAAFLIFDMNSNVVHVITDRLGVYPLYAANNEFLVISSHPDILADTLLSNGVDLSIDELTIAEGLATSECVGSSTYYKQIKSLSPASHYQFHLGQDNALPRYREYWKPSSFQNEELSLEFWAKKIADALVVSMQNRVHKFNGAAALFLSGGADSRALLYACDFKECLTAYTFADSPNPESMVASKIARVTGVKQSLLYRDFDHYGLNAREAVAVTAGMWSLKDNHIHGFAEALTSAKVGVIISGDYADYMFKALAVNKTQVKYFGKGFSLDRYSEFEFQFYQPHIKISYEWESKVKERLNTHFPKSVRSNKHLIEDLRMRPLRRGPDCLQDLWLIRMMPWDPPFTDNALIDVYDALPMKFKLNGKAYGAAIRLLSTAEQQKIVNNNTGAPIGASEFRLILQDLINKFSNKLKTRLGFFFKKQQSGLATSGSWPNFSIYISQSPVISSLWANPSIRVISLFTEILGFNPWERSMASWGASEDTIQLFLRALTIKLWLDSRGY